MSRSVRRRWAPSVATLLLALLCGVPAAAVPLAAAYGAEQSEQATPASAAEEPTTSEPSATSEPSTTEASTTAEPSTTPNTSTTRSEGPPTPRSTTQTTASRTTASRTTASRTTASPAAATTRPGGTTSTTADPSSTTGSSLPSLFGGGHPAQPAPKLQDDQAVALGNAATPIDVLANDTGVPTDGTLVITRSPDVGVAQVDGRRLVYRAPLGFRGVVTLRYGVRIGGKLCDSATVTIQVLPPAGTFAVDDEARTTFGTPVTVPVLANDVPGDGVDRSRLSVALSGPSPRHGLLAAGGDGVVYTPKFGFAGTDRFGYDLLLDGVPVDRANVAVTVAPAPPKPKPVAVDDEAVVAAFGTVAIRPADNDVNADGYAVVLDSGPAAGTVTVDGDVVSYTPAPGAAVAEDSFTYHLQCRAPGKPATGPYLAGTVPDVFGGWCGPCPYLRSNTATVHVRITGPVAVDDAVTTLANGPVTVDVLGNDTGVDPRSLYRVGLGAAPANGTAEPSGDAVVYRPRPGFVGTDRFSYTVSAFTGSGYREVARASVSVQVIAPQLPEVSVRTDAGEPVLVPFPPGLDLDGFTLQPDRPGHGRTGPGAPAWFAYTPNPGFTGVDRFGYALLADGAEVARGAVEIVVAAPIAVPDTAQAFTGIDVRIPLRGNDLHADGFTVSAAAPAHGTVSVAPDGSAVYRSSPDFPPDGVGTDAFTYHLLDSSGEVVASAPVTITVRRIALLPDDAVTSPDQPVRIPVLANDTVPPGFAPLLASVPDIGRAAVDGDAIVYTPATGFETVTFSYVVADADGARSAPALVTVHLIDAADDTVVSPHGLPVTVDVLANDTADGATTVVLLGDPSGGTLTASAPGVFVFTPGSATAGSGTFRYGLEHDGRLVDTALVTVRYGDTPDAVDDEATTSEGVAVLIPLLANDVGAQGLQARVTSAPAHGTVTPQDDGTVRYQPDAGFLGDDEFRYVLTDGDYGFDTARVVVHVVRPATTTTTTTTEPSSSTTSTTTTTPSTTTTTTTTRPTTATTTTRPTTTTTTPRRTTTITTTRRTTTTTRPIARTTTTRPAATTRPTSRTTTTTRAVVIGPTGGPATTRPTRTTGTSTSTTTTTTPPTPPVTPSGIQAVDDIADTAPGEPVEIAVTANDLDGDGDLDPGSVALVTLPSHGTATIGTVGVITYTPDATTQAFTDTFAYRASDSTGASDTARVTIRIGALGTLVVSPRAPLPGQTVAATGRGCRPGQAVRLSVDGRTGNGTTARDDGTFEATVEAGSAPGRRHVRALCGPRAMDAVLDVVLIQSSGGVSSGAAAVALLGAGTAVLAFYLLSGSLLAPTAGRSPRANPARRRSS